MDMDNLQNREKRLANGFVTTAFGKLVFQTAFHPIVVVDNGRVRVAGHEAVARVKYNKERICIRDYFEDLRPSRLLLVDAITMAMHLRNFAELKTNTGLLFVNANPRSAHRLKEVTEALSSFSERADLLGIDRSQIVVELTEDRSVSDPALSFVASHIKRLGMRVAVDDFGAQASNLIRAITLNPDFVKFDMDWLRRMLMSAEGNAIVRRLVEQFHERNIATVAEGIETRFEASSAYNAGITHFQGFGIAQPSVCNLSFSPPAIGLSCFEGAQLQNPANDDANWDGSVLNA